MTLWRHGAEPMKRRSKARPLSRGARRDPVATVQVRLRGYAPAMPDPEADDVDLHEETTDPLVADLHNF